MSSNAEKNTNSACDSLSSLERYYGNANRLSYVPFKNMDAVAGCWFAISNLGHWLDVLFSRQNSRRAIQKHCFGTMYISKRKDQDSTVSTFDTELLTGNFEAIPSIS